LMVEKQAVRAAQSEMEHLRAADMLSGKAQRSAWSLLGSLGSPVVSTAP